MVLCGFVWLCLALARFGPFRLLPPNFSRFFPASPRFSQLLVILKHFGPFLPVIFEYFVIFSTFTASFGGFEQLQVTLAASEIFKPLRLISQLFATFRILRESACTCLYFHTFLPRNKFAPVFV